MSTASTDGARAHARAQAGTVAATQPTVPATSLADPPAGVDAADVLWDETIGAGGYATRTLPRGARVRLVDVDGDTCAGLLLHRADAPAERLSVADTVKLQWQAYPAPGYLLLSDMGRVPATMVEDTCGHHDTFCATSNRTDNERRYGDGSAHGSTPNGRDRFVVALAKHGLTERDVAPNVNLLSSGGGGPGRRPVPHRHARGRTGLHERAGRGRRHALHRRRHLGARQARGGAGARAIPWPPAIASPCSRP